MAALDHHPGDALLQRADGRAPQETAGASRPGAVGARVPQSSTSARAESAAALWSRRALSLSVLGLVAALGVVGAPLWLGCALALDLAARQVRKRPRTRALGFFSLYLACEVGGVLAAALLWLGTMGGRLGGPTRFVAANAALQRVWSHAIFRGGTWLFAMRVEVEGLELARRGPLLLLVRHSSVADTVLAAALVANPNRLLLRYVLKRELLWDPCLDIVGRRLPNAFVDRHAGRHAGRARGEVEAIARLAVGLDSGSAVLIYPEGTRFSQRKLERGVEALRAGGQSTLAGIAAGFRHVLPPRLGGPLALLEAAPGVDVVIVEHTGFEGAATFASFWAGGLVGRTVRVRLRRIGAESLPTRDRDRWLFERWAEVDRWIDAHGDRSASAADPGAASAP
ncbi:MAG: lysophospholipid acyltransferase family protein [Deltaproteobacteria bacterium]|nr:lysophospholipid acyltransferase family protein [Deltaproteobacteria bacterium]